MTETPNQPKTRTIEKYLEVYQGGVRIYHTAVDLVIEVNKINPRNLVIDDDFICYRKDGQAVSDYRTRPMSTPWTPYRSDPDALTITGKNLVTILKGRFE